MRVYLGEVQCGKCGRYLIAPMNGDSCTFFHVGGYRKHV